MRFIIIMVEKCQENNEKVLWISVITAVLAVAFRSSVKIVHHNINQSTVPHSRLSQFVNCLFIYCPALSEAALRQAELLT